MVPARKEMVDNILGGGEKVKISLRREGGERSWKVTLALEKQKSFYAPEA